MPTVHCPTCGNLVASEGDSGLCLVDGTTVQMYPPEPPDHIAGSALALLQAVQAAKSAEFAPLPDTDTTFSAIALEMAPEPKDSPATYEHREGEAVVMPVVLEDGKVSEAVVVPAKPKKRKGG